MAGIASDAFSVMLNTSSPAGEAAAKLIAERLSQTRDPASTTKGMPPLYGEDAIPHLVTFSSLVGTFSKTYLNPDQAMRDSIENAHLMRTDVGLLESVENRMRLTALLDWEVVPENEENIAQLALANELKKILSRIKNFTRYKFWLMDAIWTGRSGIQHTYGNVLVDGAWRMMPKPKHKDHNGWMPVNGDKIVYRYDDGGREQARSNDAYPHQMGLRVAYMGTGDRRIHNRDRQLEPTGDGMAYFLRPWERDTFVVHKHLIEDADYHYSHFAGAIHGIGIRSKIYWEWYLKQEAFAFLMQYLERSAGGIEVWTYPAGDDQALQKCKQAAAERSANGRNSIFFPRPLGEDGNQYDVQIIEPGAMGLDIIQNIIERYFGGRLKRYILGQELSTEAHGTGLGSGVAQAHMDTLAQIVHFDAANFSETITHELVRYIQLLNFPETAGWHMRFRLKTESDDAQKRLDAFSGAYQMGLAIPEAEVFKVLGIAAPKPGDKTLSMQQTQQQQATLQMAMQPAMPQDVPQDGDGDGVAGEGDDTSAPAPRFDTGEPNPGDRAAEPQPYRRDGEVDQYAQMAFDFDESVHPREQTEHAGKHAGQFAPKGQGSIFGGTPKGSLFGANAPAHTPGQTPAGLAPLKPAGQKSLFDTVQPPAAPVPKPNVPAVPPAAPKPAMHTPAGVSTPTGSHRILAAMKQVNPRVQAGDMASIPDIRAASGLHPDEFNKHLQELVENKTLAAHRFDRPQMVSDEQRNQMWNYGDVWHNTVSAYDINPGDRQRINQMMNDAEGMLKGGTQSAPAATAPARPRLAPKQVGNMAPVGTVDQHGEPATGGMSLEDAIDFNPAAKKPMAQKPAAAPAAKPAVQPATPGPAVQSPAPEDRKLPRKPLTDEQSKLANDHVKLIQKAVRSFIKKQPASARDTDSLEHAATAGLMKSAAAFDASHGVPFEPFAMKQMHQSIFNEFKSRKQGINRKIKSVTDDEGGLEDVLKAPSAEPAEYSEMKENAGKALSGLPENEQQLVRAVLNFDNQPGNLDDRAKSLGFESRNAAMYHFNKIMKKLRGSLDPDKEEYQALRYFVVRYYRHLQEEVALERYERRIARKIREAATETCTDPTESQIKAGNYRKGRFKWNGLTVVIENPKGSTRRGMSRSGRVWERMMPCHYGYFSRTNGDDGDQTDVYIGPHPESEFVAVIEQVDKNGRFDEYKVVIGTTNKEAAKALYLANYPKGWTCGPIQTMSLEQFKEWLQECQS